MILNLNSIFSLGGNIMENSFENHVSKLTVSEVAKIMGYQPQFLRLSLQQGLFDFGVAVKTSSNRYTYYINANKFYKYMGSE